MNLSKLIYELGYRYSNRMPYEMGPPKELVELVESGRISPCRAIDLGCGTGGNAVYLAQHGFDVTGVDFSSSAIAKARRRAETARLSVEFVVDDLTNLQKVRGTFDFLTDFGVLDVLHFKVRDLYVRSVLPLTHPGSRYLLSGWEWPLSRWEQLLMRRLSIWGAILEPGEAAQRFGEYFEIEQITHETNPRHRLPTYFLIEEHTPGFAVYLMTRRTGDTRESQTTRGTGRSHSQLMF